MNVSIPPHGPWVTAPGAVLSPLQRYWLQRPGALTAGLRAQGAMTLEVVREYASGLPAAEAPLLRKAPGTPIWIREIVMSVDGVRSVFARSFTPLRASHGLWQGMRRLRTRPLADMLYHDPQITRSPFLVARLQRQEPIYRSLCRMPWAGTPPAPQALLARCSVFMRHDQPLLVAECFLPDYWTFAVRT